MNAGRVRGPAPGLANSVGIDWTAIKIAKNKVFRLWAAPPQGKPDLDLPHCLEREQGGAGILLGGVAGTNAARMAARLEASATIIDRSMPRLKELDPRFGARATTLSATAEAIERSVLAADLVIGAMLVAGAAAPKLVTRDMILRMRPGSVLVDIAIDQGGCFETSRPTTPAAPTCVEDGVVHYRVTNMPGAVPRTST